MVLPSIVLLLPAALPGLLGLVVLLAMLDAVLNSFVYSPVRPMAGALADDDAGTR